jgi:hypothetical protein
MADTAKLREDANRIMWLALKGQDEFSAKMVVALVIAPTLDFLDSMETTRGERWRTLAEAIRESQRGRNFFEKRRAREGGTSRLEDWKVEGFADQTEEGVWLISPLKVKESGRDGCGGVEREKNSAPHGLDVEALASRFTAAGLTNGDSNGRA